MLLISLSSPAFPIITMTHKAMLWPPHWRETRQQILRRYLTCFSGKKEPHAGHDAMVPDTAVDGAAQAIVTLTNSFVNNHTTSRIPAHYD